MGSIRVKGHIPITPNSHRTWTEIQQNNTLFMQMLSSLFRLYQNCGIDVG